MFAIEKFKTLADDDQLVYAELVCIVAKAFDPTMDETNCSWRGAFPINAASVKITHASHPSLISSETMKQPNDVLPDFIASDWR